MATSSSFDQLSVGVQRWIYRQGWQGLRAVQERTIPLILEGEADLLLTAPTAGGKTEAAFLPLVSWLEKGGAPSGYGVLCLSPLKALINDQFNRLELLCDSAQTSITPWHGDVSQSVKRQSWRNASGILMITPESLESMFVRRPVELRQRLQHLRYVVIDEFHAFIGQERGQQLISQLARLEAMIKRPIRRIALSATIGDSDMALACLRPDSSREGIHLDVPGEQLDLKLLLKAYQPTDDGMPAELEMAKDLFDWLRGDSHLVFANSRRVVEEMTDRLTSLSENAHVPLEFYAHHGSLSKEARHFVENRLREGEKPTTAIATSTLELGIDIGDVKSVGQIGPPNNVSSLRQRLGRSGRRAGQSAILRTLVNSESNLKDPDPTELLELELFQSIAVIDKLLQRWIEPPDTSRLHLSTLIQQLLSMIAYQGEITAGEAYETLCVRGPWRSIDQDFFKRFLRSIASQDVISQLPSGELIVGLAGEREISRYDFYTAFQVPEEFRLTANGKTIGTIPVDNPVMSGQLMLFAGRRWKVEAVDFQQKIISLVKGGSGIAPKFGGERAAAHREVHRHMRHWYESGDIPAYCDEKSQALIPGARKFYLDNQLANCPMVQSGDDIYWLVWEDARVINTLVILATALGLTAGTAFGPVIVIKSANEPYTLVQQLLNFMAGYSTQALTAEISAIPIEKYDHLLGDEMMIEAYIRSTLNLHETEKYLKSFSTYRQ